MAGEGGKGKLPNHGFGASAVRTDSPFGAKSAGFCRMPEKSP